MYFESLISALVMYINNLFNIINSKLSTQEIFDRVNKGEDLRIINKSIIKKNYLEFCETMKFATIHIATKANSSNSILKMLDELGSNFEIASLDELLMCIEVGINPNKIIFTHPAKDKIEIEESYKLGVKTFASDSEEDIELIGKYAPNSNIMIRLKSNNKSKIDDQVTGFDDRFGVPKENIINLFLNAKALGLNLYGLSFHIGT